MVEPYYTVLRTLHAGGGYLAFGVAPIALLTTKGSRLHVLAGRLFLVSMTTGVTAGLPLAVNAEVPSLFCFGLVALSFLATGYLAPHIGRGSRRGYRWDRVFTGVGVIGSAGMIADLLIEGSTALGDLAFGGLGLGVFAAHGRWQGPRDPSRWQVEHLTSLLAAYTILWAFVNVFLGFHLPELVIPALGLIAILWARRRTWVHPLSSRA